MEDKHKNNTQKRTTWDNMESEYIHVLFKWVGSTIHYIYSIHMNMSENVQLVAVIEIHFIIVVVVVVAIALCYYHSFSSSFLLFYSIFHQQTVFWKHFFFHTKFMYVISSASIFFLFFFLCCLLLFHFSFVIMDIIMILYLVAAILAFTERYILTHTLSTQTILPYIRIHTIHKSLLSAFHLEKEKNRICRNHSKLYELCDGIEVKIFCIRQRAAKCKKKKSKQQEQAQHKHGNSIIIGEYGYVYLPVCVKFT